MTNSANQNPNQNHPGFNPGTCDASAHPTQLASAARTWKIQITITPPDDCNHCVLLAHRDNLQPVAAPDYDTALKMAATASAILLSFSSL